MAESTYHDPETGRFLQGNPGGPGRPRGALAPAFEQRMRVVLEENAEEFARVFAEMLLDKHPAAWAIAAKYGLPAPPKGIGISLQDGPAVVKFAWKEPAKNKCGKKPRTNAGLEARDANVPTH